MKIDFFFNGIIIIIISSIVIVFFFLKMMMIKWKKIMTLMQKDKGKKQFTILYDICYRLLFFFEYCGKSDAGNGENFVIVKQ